jgi:hypothetical protein
MPTRSRCTMYYNFVRIRQALRTTPAMAAGVTKRLTEIHDVVDVFEAWAALGA